MPLHLKWSRYFYDLFSQILRHIGTALTGWGGLNVAHAGGVAGVPALNFKALGIFLVAAAVIPALSSFFQKTPLPEIEETTVTITTTKTTPPNETKPPVDLPPANP